MPNRPVDVDSRGRSACYPRRTFCPLRDGPPTRNHRITKAWFPTCSSRRSRSQAPFCLCTHRAIADRAEGTFARLRYPLGGDRPSQTAHQRLSRPVHPARERAHSPRVVFHRRLHRPRRDGFPGSHLSYARRASTPSQAAVKVHGVFLSCRGYSVSSPRLQFRRACGGDSAQVVTPFVQVGTYPTRNFATLGPL